MDERQDARYGVAELAEAAGVSIRTIRYYIAEGLLPPPAERGPGASYSTGHLDRLRLIGRLKDAYLPLREIRRRLDGLDDEAVRSLLARLGPGGGGRAPSSPGDEAPPTDSAAEYLARVLGRPAGWEGRIVRATARRAPDRPDAAPPAPRFGVGKSPPAPEQESGIVEAALGRPTPAWPDTADDRVWPDGAGGPPVEAIEEATVGEPVPLLDLDPALELAAPLPQTAPAGEGPWRRVALGPDAELLIREETYQRRRDRIEWLIGWARKVFQS
jgi:DNA-binding transcriptional MerR regulator